MLQGGSLYTGLCSAVGSMGWLVQFSLQYNCTQEILQGGMSAEEKCTPDPGVVEWCGVLL